MKERKLITELLWLNKFKSLRAIHTNLDVIALRVRLMDA